MIWPSLNVVGATVYYFEALAVLLWAAWYYPTWPTDLIRWAWSKLRNYGATPTAVITQGHLEEAYRLKAPVVANVVRYADEEGIYLETNGLGVGWGVTLDSAMVDLASVIMDGFDDLVKHPDSKLGPAMLEKKRRLLETIEHAPPGKDA